MADFLDGYLYANLKALKADLRDFEARTGLDEAQLAAQITLIKRRHYELSTLVTTLVETLAAAGALDTNVLEARLEARRAADPWSADHPEPVTADKPYLCTKCFRAIAMAAGMLTANGMRCNRCGYAA
jgi:DNA-directed RNA polymerase subunit RPC12/RpoP